MVCPGEDGQYVPGTSAGTGHRSGRRHHTRLGPGGRLSNNGTASGDSGLRTAGLPPSAVRMGSRSGLLIDLPGKGSYQLVVNLDEAGFPGSAGLGVLAGGLNRVRARDGSLDLVCTRERILKIFKITGLTKVFGICQTVDQAIAARGRRQGTCHRGEVAGGFGVIGGGGHTRAGRGVLRRGRVWWATQDPCAQRPAAGVTCPPGGRRAPVRLTLRLAGGASRR